jgi:hypothetical protein
MFTMFFEQQRHISVCISLAKLRSQCSPKKDSFTKIEDNVFLIKVNIFYMINISNVHMPKNVGAFIKQY